MAATEKFFAFLSATPPNLLTLTEEEFAAFDEDAKKRLLTDYNVGQVWTLEASPVAGAWPTERIHYLVPNPPSETRDEFHALRAAWQQESSVEP